MIIAGVLISILIASLVVYLSHLFIIYNIREPNIVGGENQSKYHPPLIIMSAPEKFNYTALPLALSPNYYTLNYVESLPIANKDPYFHVYPSLVIATPNQSSFIIYIYYSANDKVNIPLENQNYTISILNSSIIDDQIVETAVQFNFSHANSNTIYLIPIWNEYNVTIYLTVFYE